MVAIHTTHLMLKLLSPTVAKRIVKFVIQKRYFPPQSISVSSV
jgi:hypothetical protein